MDSSQDNPIRKLDKSFCEESSSKSSKLKSLKSSRSKNANKPGVLLYAQVPRPMILTNWKATPEQTLLKQNPILEASNSNETNPKLRLEPQSDLERVNWVDNVQVKLSKLGQFKRIAKAFNKLYTHCQLTFILARKDFSLDTRKIIYKALFFEETTYQWFNFMPIASDLLFLE